MEPVPSVRELIEEFNADREELTSCYAAPSSISCIHRLQELMTSRLSRLEQIDFASLEGPERVDAALWHRHLTREQRLLREQAAEIDALNTSLPFLQEIFDLEDQRLRMEFVDGRHGADRLSAINHMVSRSKLEGLDAWIARLPGLVGKAREALKKWSTFYVGYDPEFSWWTRKPLEDLGKSLEEFEKSIPIDMTLAAVPPISRERIISALRECSISASPEELVAIAERDLAFCRAEMQKAAHEMGFATVIEAIEACKDDCVPPGGQPRMVRDLLVEAIDYVTARDLVTVPPIAIETMQMTMISAEDQKVSPFFLGGSLIHVSYATDQMVHSDKLMSMRGNNPAFSRAAAQHEMIPGHHLQWYSEQRFRPYRRPFWTAFWVEGWTLHWEMLLWDLGFPRTPQERLGMLFWRSHRGARVVFSLGYHLGTLSAQQCVDMLVDDIHHERANAEAEVRRSFGGEYDPLYQLAYLIGGKMVRSLYRDAVSAGRTPKEFHDAFLRQNNIDLGVMRSVLHGHKITSVDEDLSWSFGDQDKSLV